ncbi:hypothetical protein J5N97_019329 [Dioscorea zingiberensis]|uniref:Uncharacterized protein n=1 Tax=Dioscorea zingiberensis TaxID=325984 RepID=A0A9D5HCK6_9LILI|nr:hypothetical protein J5N97_019329 [Dioscorea zingiberensis]
MPGTIHVSVFDLMDLPFEGSPLILKFAMGKREYQTGDKGECSFPVMSLRENLVLMLHDKEGNEISRTEFRTMSVVEKGIWDDLFPLKGGGHIRMRVQFSLSEEERLRIREMRESVVRKKQSELLKGKETGLLGPNPTTEDNTKIAKAEQMDPVSMKIHLALFHCKNLENPLYDHLSRMTSIILNQTKKRLRFNARQMFPL